MLRRMTSATNATELDRLRRARTQAQEQFARQMALLDEIEKTAGELDQLNRRWSNQLAALADLSGSAATAAEISGLPKAQIEAAVKAASPDEVKAAADLAGSAPRRRRRRSAKAVDAGPSSTPRPEA
jgi:hypothetical protein